jgi:single-strand DNA-binding protein
MASYNRVILVGNLTRDPEIRYIPSGTAVCDIGLAVNEKYKNAKGEWVEQATFVDVVLWARTAEVASEYLSKGSQVLVEGRLKLDTWEKDGEKKSKLRVVCDRMVMVGPRQGGGAAAAGGAARGAPQGRPRGGEADYGQEVPPDDFGPPPQAPEPEPSQGDDIPF